MIEEVQYLSNRNLQEGNRENEEIEMSQEIIKENVLECIFIFKVPSKYGTEPFSRMKKNLLSHMLLTHQDTSDKEKILKTSRERKRSPVKEPMSDFSTTTSTATDNGAMHANF